MSGISIKVDMARVQDLMARLAARSQDLSPALREVGELVLTSVRDNFRAGRGPDGAPWKPSRRAIKQRGQTLVDTARLMSSVTAETTARSVAVGTSVEYGAIHQLGGLIRRKGGPRTIAFKTFKRGPRKGRTLFSTLAKATHARQVTVRDYVIRMPARPYLGVKEADWPNIAGALARYLTGE